MRKLISLLVITLLAVHCVGAVSSRRRRDSDDNGDSKDSGVLAILGGGLDTLQGLPVAGGFIAFGRTWLTDTFNALQDVTNGGFARVLGGALPCQIDKDTGIHCTGISDEANVAALIMTIVRQTPLPTFVQSLIENVLEALADPAANFVFGGVPTS